MPDLRLNTTAAVLLAFLPFPLCAQKPVQSAGDLMRDVIYNELHDRDHEGHWEYLTACQSPDKNLVQEQVETEEGPVFRVLSRDGVPLDAAQQRKEDERLDAYIHDPAQIARVRREHLQDEQHLDDIIAIAPQAFLFDYAPGASGEQVHITFRPNPAFVPSTYAARIVHALRGSITVDGRYKRLIDLRGVVGERVDFGFGVLGHVEKGGTFEWHRRQLRPDQWKTDLMDIHIEGKLLLFRTVGKDQHETRSDFHPVPGDLTLAAAENLLNQQASSFQTAQASLSPAE